MYVIRTAAVILTIITIFVMWALLHAKKITGGTRMWDTIEVKMDEGKWFTFHHCQYAVVDGVLKIWRYEKIKDVTATYHPIMAVFMLDKIVAFICKNKE